ncbi:hypothetical protein [Novosphingobium sp.]|uniref:hypothetical protein n=1 Tax=Novosphingobium sp. TaxID=1874826 RepID=UPI002FE20FFC
MISALVGPTTNHQPGDIVTTDEGARWIEFGIAEAIDVTATKPATETTETAAVAPAKEAASRCRTKVSK